jgi:hypothetical protein
MRLYIAGPLFTSGDREYVDRLSARLGDAGHDCFVPHQQTFEPLDAPTVFEVDSSGLYDAEAMVAVLDGPLIDDGTACEIGMFCELVRTRPNRYRGVVGLSSDWRTDRRRRAGMSDDGGLNYFVSGAVLRYGRLVWTEDDVASALAEWASSD